MTTEKQCEFGCECDTVNTFDPADAVLNVADFERLVVEKIDRARRYMSLQERIGGQFETD